MFPTNTTLEGGLVDILAVRGGLEADLDETLGSVLKIRYYDAIAISNGNILSIFGSAYIVVNKLSIV